MLENDHWSEAGLLSEQFHDFENLIRVYSATKNESDFARYLKISGFPQFVHKNFSGEKLIDIGVRHGGEIKELILADKTHGWMLEARSESYSAAHEKLAANAGEADMSLSRKSYLSIAKLAAIAGGNSSPEPTTAEILLDFQARFEYLINSLHYFYSRIFKCFKPHKRMSSLTRSIVFNQILKLWTLMILSIA